MVVQQQALRDFKQAMSNYFGGTHGKPTWRKARLHEGFRVVGPKSAVVRRLSRKVGEVLVPKAGWVRFRWSRQVPEARSFRVTKDRSGRWHIAFAVCPPPLQVPHNGRLIGVDRGVVVSAALSTGELLTVPGLAPKERERLLRLRRRMDKCDLGSKRRARHRTQLARLTARETDRRKNWVEQVTTSLAANFEVIAIEDLNVKAMTRSARSGNGAKAGMNRAILGSGWGLFARRLEEKAPNRVVKVNPAFTSQRCNSCGEVDRRSRESQASFRCTSCGHADHADVNAARNIRDTAAGRAVAARGGSPLGRPMNREPQLLLTS